MKHQPEIIFDKPTIETAPAEAQLVLEAAYAVVAGQRAQEQQVQANKEAILQVLAELPPTNLVIDTTKPEDLTRARKIQSRALWDGKDYNGRPGKEGRYIIGKRARGEQTDVLLAHQAEQFGPDMYGDSDVAIDRFALVTVATKHFNRVIGAAGEREAANYSRDELQTMVRHESSTADPVLMIDSNASGSVRLDYAWLQRQRLYGRAKRQHQKMEAASLSRLEYIDGPIGPERLKVQSVNMDDAFLQAFAVADHLADLTESLGSTK